MLLLPAPAPAQETLPPTESPPPLAAQQQKQQHSFMGEREAQFASREGNVAFLALGVGLPLLTDGGEKGRTRALRTLDALGTSTALCYALKSITRQMRPDNSTRDSFPSGHATAAFAVAAMQGRFHRDQAPLWYAGAALIAYSRVRLNRHRPSDVTAGAALGSGTAHWGLSTRRGLLMAPFLMPRADGGLSLGWSGGF